MQQVYQPLVTQTKLQMYKIQNVSTRAKIKRANKFLWKLETDQML